MDRFKAVWLSAYEDGLKDGTVRPLDDPGLFYYATTHAVLSLCKKLAAERGVIRQDQLTDKAAEVLSNVRQMVMAHDYVLQIHGFHYHEADKEFQFDVVLDFAAPDRQALYEEICREVQAAYPDHKVHILLDADVSD